MRHEEPLTIPRDDRVGEFTAVTHVTEFYCPACTTGIIVREEVDFEAFLADHFDCVPDGYTPGDMDADDPRTGEGTSADGAEYCYEIPFACGCVGRYNRPVSHAEASENHYGQCANYRRITNRRRD